MSPARLDSKRVYTGRVLNLDIDTVRFPNGSEGQLEMIRHSGAAAVLPFVGSMDGVDPEVVLIRQYRYAADGFLYEIPAGRLSPGEEPLACARRELMEETGYTARLYRHLTTIFTTPGFTDERIHLFAAEQLIQGTAAHEVDEFIEVVRLPFATVLDLTRRGDIADAKSLTAILYAAEFATRVLGR
jgi:ADP-ribose pyrophosphatase